MCIYETFFHKEHFIYSLNLNHQQIKLVKVRPATISQCNNQSKLTGLLTVFNSFLGLVELKNEKTIIMASLANIFLSLIQAELFRIIIVRTN